MQSVPALPRGARARCPRCARPLAYGSRDAAVSLACTLATLVLLAPENVLPLLEVKCLGVTARATAWSCVASMLHERMLFLALATFLFAIAAPIARAALLSLVLGAVVLGRRLPRAGLLFRLAERVRPWAMLDVLLLSLLFTYLRVTEQSGDVVEIRLGAGGLCLCAIIALRYASALWLDPRAVWAAIAPERPVARGAPAVPCEACALVVEGAKEGDRCPRCEARLERARPASPGIAAALVAAALVLYPASYVYPMIIVEQPDGHQEHTILSGISDLFSAGMWYYGILIFCASVAIPLAKLASLTWTIARALRPDARRVRARTRLHRFTEEIGRWSMMDPLVIASSVPIMIVAGLAEVHAGPGVTPFTSVVVLTVLAARTIDPRLMWRPGGGGARS